MTESISAGGRVQTLVLTPRALTNVSCKRQKDDFKHLKETNLGGFNDILNLNEVETRDRRSRLLDKLVFQSLPPLPKEVGLATSGETVIKQTMSNIILKMN